MTQKPSVTIKPVKINMRDGINLSGDLYILTSQNLGLPTLLVRTPYGRNETASKIDAIELARKGWAVVIQNVRGRYESEGIFTPFLQEYNDGFDTVEWCCRQTWSDSRVAMSGASYAGFTQWSCAIAQPNGLKAISPQITSSDIKDGWFYEGGAFRKAFAQSWGLSLAFTKPDNKPKVNKEIWKWAADLRKLYSSISGHKALIKLLPAYSEWAMRENDKYWSQIPFLNKNNVSLPVYHLTGWYDIFCEGSIKDFITQEQKDIDEETKSIRRLVIGPWHHSPFLNQFVGEIDFGLEGNGFLLEIMNEMHSWLLSVMDNNEVVQGVKLFILGKNVWKEFGKFPIPDSTKKLFLDGEKSQTLRKGVLITKPSENVFIEHFFHKPKHPVPTLGGRTLDPTLPLQGPIDQTSMEDRDDVLIYETSPLNEEINVIGSVQAMIYFSCNNESADVIVKLIDVCPDGKAFHILGSVQRMRCVPGKLQAAEVKLGTIAVTFKRGHRIRVDICASNFPHLNINFGDSKSNNTLLKNPLIKYSVYSGGIASSYIELPIIEFI